jgi:hypothetical protein
MGNTGFLEVTLRDVAGVRIEDPKTEFTFFRMPQRTQLGDILTFKLPPNPLSFKLPAFPQAHAIACTINPDLYRTWDSGTQIFTLADQQTLRVEFTVARKPQSWNARFTRWDQLSQQFNPLKRALKNSPTVVVAGNAKPFTEAGFDDVDDDPSRLAKTALMNLYAKMTLLIEPAEDELNWFSFVDRILSIGRERMIAVVRPGLADLVRFIRNNHKTFREEYEPADSSLHFKNFPAEFRSTFQPSDMFSIKSTEALGNLQLTLAPAKDAAGQNILLLDADIDENGELLRHFFDLLKHRFTGGTHPYDIHEILRHSNRDFDFGYTLNPA